MSQLGPEVIFFCLLIIFILCVMHAAAHSVEQKIYDAVSSSELDKALDTGALGLPFEHKANWRSDMQDVQA